MKRFRLLNLCLIGFLGLYLPLSASADERPNILFITVEDLSAHFGAYGSTVARTPTIDRFAAENLRFDRMFGVAGVCAPNRSCIITGMHPQAIGTQHMRTRAVLSDTIRPFPALLREAGYYTTNNYKQDYNFLPEDDVWDENGKKAHWENRPEGQPFFAVFNYMATHEGFVALGVGGWSRMVAKLKPEEITNPDDITVPPYYPDTPRVREILARQLDNVIFFDRFVSGHLKSIEAAGLAENTIVFILSDHGDGYLRMKRSLYDSGTRVPFIVHLPEKYRPAGQAEPGTSTEELVSMVDLAPTFLHLAGVDIPEWIQGQAFLGPDRAEPRKFVYGGRDRMDERTNLQRFIRQERYSYIRTYRPEVTEFMRLRAPSRGDLWHHFEALDAEGELPELTRAYFHDPVPVEQLYDTYEDPHQIHNLADDPAYAQIKDALADELREWQLEIVDSGMISEGILGQIEGEEGIYARLRSPEYQDWVPTALDAADKAVDPTTTAMEIVRMTESPYPAVRFWAAYAMEQRAIDEPEVLRPLLDDPFTDVRSQAVAALLAIGQADADALQRLEGALMARNNIGAQIVAANIIERYAESMRPLLPAMTQAAKFRLPGYGRAINAMLNQAFDKLGEPHIEL